MERHAASEAIASRQNETGFRLPQRACDTHCHVLGPVARFPYSPECKYTPADSPKETLADLHAGLGVERAVLVQPMAHGTDCRALLDALAWRPDCWRGVALIDNDTDDTELARMHDAGVRGIRFNFVKSLGGYPDPAVFARSVDRAADLGWHVVLHLRGEDLVELREPIERLPVPFVIDHMGRLDADLGTSQAAFLTLLELMEGENAWVKLSAPERMCPYPYEMALPFARALADFRPNRILWGTDFPHPNLTAAVDERDLVALIPHYAESAELQRLMLVDNPARLYDFDVEQ